MSRMPEAVAACLGGRRFAVAGVSREPAQAANAIYRKLRDSGYEVYPVNPSTDAVEGVACYPEVGAVPAKLDGVVIATHPRVAVELVRQCAAAGVGQVWFHRSLGGGSVAPEAVRECAERGLRCIVGGCPLMYCAPVDPFHRCLGWFLNLTHGVRSAP